MTNTGAFHTTWTPRLLSILRIVTGFLFTAHGTQKLFDYPASGSGAAPLLSMIGAAGVIEVAGGLLIIFGLYTCAAAFVLSGLMAVAYFTAHAPGGFLPIVNKGELAVIYCFVFLYLSAAGGGAWSLDRLLSGRKSGRLTDGAQRAAATVEA